MEQDQPLGTTQPPGLSNPAMEAKPSNDSGLTLAPYGASDNGAPRYTKSNVNITVQRITSKLTDQEKTYYKPLVNYVGKNSNMLDLFAQLIDTVANASSQAGRSAVNTLRPKQ